MKKMFCVLAFIVSLGCTVVSAEQKLCKFKWRNVFDKELAVPSGWRVISFTHEVSFREDIIFCILESDKTCKEQKICKLKMNDIIKKEVAVPSGWRASLITSSEEDETIYYILEKE